MGENVPQEVLINFEGRASHSVGLKSRGGLGWNLMAPPVGHIYQPFVRAKEAGFICRRQDFHLDARKQCRSLVLMLGGQTVAEGVPFRSSDAFRDHRVA